MYDTKHHGHDFLNFYDRLQTHNNIIIVLISDNVVRQNKVTGQTYKFESAEATNIECKSLRLLQCSVEFIRMWHQG